MTTVGWRPTLVVLAGLAAVVAAPVMLVLLRSRPADKGLEPYGGASVLVPEERQHPEAPPVRVERPPVSALLRRREFWGLALPFFVCGYTTTGMIDTHLIPLAHDHGYGTATTGAAVGVLAVFNVLGTLASGPLADRYDSRLILAGLYGMRAITLVLLLFTHSAPSLLVFSLTFGLVDFATVAPTQVLAEQVVPRPLPRPRLRADLPRAPDRLRRRRVRARGAARSRPGARPRAARRRRCARARDADECGAARPETGGGRPARPAASPA